MTKQQKKDVRKALRRYGMEREEEKNTAAEWVRAWGTVIRRAMDYYEKSRSGLRKAVAAAVH